MDEDYNRDRASKCRLPVLHFLGFNLCSPTLLNAEQKDEVPMIVHSAARLLPGPTKGSVTRRDAEGVTNVRCRAESIVNGKCVFLAWCMQHNFYFAERPQ